mgnify:CR=1 FL=1
MDTALHRAYELEKKGMEFYIESAIKSKNALARRTLFSLAQEEIKHMMKVDEISFALDNTEKWPKITALVHGSIEESIKQFFNNTGKEFIDRDSEGAHIIEEAMEFEKNSYELYSELSKKSEPGQQREFYTELMNQEREHCDALDNVYYYLMNTGDWFEKEESRSWNWMNM